jgi:hypothetical protein
VSYSISVDFVVEAEEDTEANVCKDGMCGFGENVIVRKTIFRSRESLRCQVLLDREVRELYYLMASQMQHTDTIASSAYAGRQSGLNVGSVSSSN